MLSALLGNSTLYLSSVRVTQKRYFYDAIKPSDKLIGIVGARGVGKTTYILHYLNDLSLPVTKKLYMSVDNIVLSNTTLLEIAKEFAAKGGEVLAIDEIHKYKNFEIELKQIYDMLDLQVIFSGSSAINLEHALADLSRRAVLYRVQGMSYREFLEFKLHLSLPSYTLDEILQNHSDIVFEIKQRLKPLEHWSEYLQGGYYPFYFEDPQRYPIKLNATINAVIETDIPSIFKIKYENVRNLKKLVALICNSEPFKLNIKALSGKIGIDRDTLYLYLDYLDREKILNVIRSRSKGDTVFVKPDKVYLNNPNLHHHYCANSPIGTMRESLFATMIRPFFTVEISKQGDFLVDEKYTFEIGGKKKSFKQIKDLPNSFIVADDMEIGFGNKIPLWLFGFLY